jgi:hypothetical protein
MCSLLFTAYTVLLAAGGDFRDVFWETLIIVNSLSRENGGGSVSKYLQTFCTAVHTSRSNNKTENVEGSTFVICPAYLQELLRCCEIYCCTWFVNLPMPLHVCLINCVVRAVCMKSMCKDTHCRRNTEEVWLVIQINFFSAGISYTWDTLLALPY